MVVFGACGVFTILPRLYMQSILHLTLIRYNSLTINTLLSVRCCQFHLHTTYTTYMLPHGTSTGGGYYGIGEQKSLLLRQFSLRPSGVNPTAYVQIGCEAPIRACVLCLCLVVAFSVCVLCLRLVVAGPLPYYKNFTYRVSYILH